MFDYRDSISTAPPQLGRRPIGPAAPYNQDGNDSDDRDRGGDEDEIRSVAVGEGAEAERPDDPEGILEEILHPEGCPLLPEAKPSDYEALDRGVGHATAEPDQDADQPGGEDGLTEREAERRKQTQLTLWRQIRRDEAHQPEQDHRPLGLGRHPELR